MNGRRPPRCGDFGSTLAVIVGLAFSISASHLSAQDEPELGWFYTAELTLLFTSGNAEAQAFGVRAGLRRPWEDSEFSLTAGGLRTETGTTIRTAVGSVDDFTLDETSKSEVTGEAYFATSRFDRSLSDRVFLYAGAGWERNTFAGFDSRIILVGGLGNTWADKESTRFKTDYGLTFTKQDDVIENPSKSNSFGGLRVSSTLWRQVTGSTAFESLLIVDQSLNEIEDLRADFTNSLIVEISTALAFKTSLRLLFDNRPSLTGVVLEQPLGTPTGDTVLVPLHKLDTIFTIALVASF